MPRGLRRSEPDHPPAGSAIGGTTITKPVVVERGLPHGSSNPGASDAHLQLEEDRASPPKVQRLSGVHEVFSLTR